MSIRPALLALAVITGSSLPGVAVARPAVESLSTGCDSFGGCAALSDAALASVHGTGIARAAFLRTAARDNSEAYYRFSAQTLPVTFDNWFNDNGTPLIVHNLSS